MHVKNVDGKPVFATHLIKINPSEKNKLLYQIEAEKNGDILCYSKNETSKVIKILNDLWIDYTLAILQDGSMVTEDTAINYQSRTEVIEHLQEKKIPKHKKESDLEKRLKIVESQLVVLMDRLNLRY